MRPFMITNNYILIDILTKENTSGNIVIVEKNMYMRLL